MTAAGAKRSEYVRLGRGWACALAAAVFSIGCSTKKPASIEQWLFDYHEIFTGIHGHQTLLPGFFLGRPSAELAVVNDDAGQTRVRLYALNGASWETSLDVRLPKASFVDLARTGGADRLLTYRQGTISWFDPEARVEHALIEVPSRFIERKLGVTPQVDITRDLNADGLDDLIMPDFDGFWIALQRLDGSFDNPVKLGPPEPLLDEIGLEQNKSYRELGISDLTVPWYLSRVHQLDQNQDGRTDLAFWNDHHFEVHLQAADRRFVEEPIPFSTATHFDVDGVYSLNFAYDRDRLPLVFGLHEIPPLTVLHSMRDINGDGLTDLVTQTVTGRSLLRMRSTYAVHWGSVIDGTVTFASRPDLTVQPRSKAGHPFGYAWPTFTDLDNDGDAELMLQMVKISIGGMIRALAGNSVALDLEFYQLDGAGDEPATVRYARPKLDVLGSRGPFFPTVLVGDIDGDRRADLLVGQHFEELHVFRGIDDPGLFAGQAQRINVGLPGNERDARLIDLDQNGKQDLLIHRPRTGPERLLILLAK